MRVLFKKKQQAQGGVPCPITANQDLIAISAPSGYATLNQFLFIKSSDL